MEDEDTPSSPEKEHCLVENPPEIHNLGLAVDHATLSIPFTQLLLFDNPDKSNEGVSICSLKMLPPDIPYWTENDSQVVRTSSNEVTLTNGEEKVLVVIPEEEEPPCPGIFVVEGQNPLLLDADEYSAENMVESLTGQRLFEGIPFFEDEENNDNQKHKKKKKSSLSKYFGLGKSSSSSSSSSSSKRKGISTGRVVFSLNTLPMNKTFLFSVCDGNPTMSTITRISEHEYKINGCKYRSAEVQQVVDDTSGLVDYVFPNLSPRRSEGAEGIIKRLGLNTPEGGKKLNLVEEDEEEKEKEEEGEEKEERHSKKDRKEKSDDEEETSEMEEIEKIESIKDAEHVFMMKQFEENLKNAVKRRQQEKEQKMASMMAKYTTGSDEDLLLNVGGGEGNRDNSNNNNNGLLLLSLSASLGLNSSNEEITLVKKELKENEENEEKKENKQEIHTDNEIEGIDSDRDNTSTEKGEKEQELLHTAETL